MPASMLDKLHIRMRKRAESPVLPSYGHDIGNKARSGMFRAFLYKDKNKELIAWQPRN